MPAPAWRSTSRRVPGARGRDRPASASFSCRASARPKPRRRRWPAPGSPSAPAISACRCRASNSSSCRAKASSKRGSRAPISRPAIGARRRSPRTAFDDEGFYKIGDALKFEDPADPAKGLLFDGRLAEDFKLATGTWVSVGPLRASLHRAFRAAGARRGARRRRPRRRSPRWCFPISTPAASSRPALPPIVRPQLLLADARVTAAFAPSPRQLRRRSERHIEPRHPRHSACRTAVARYRRNDRQRLDQPARGACASRGFGRRALRRRAAAARHRRRAQRNQPKVFRHGYSRTCRDRHRRRLGPRRRHRRMLAEAGAKVAIFDVNDEARECRPPKRSAASPFTATSPKPRRPPPPSPRPRTNTARRASWSIAPASDRPSASSAATARCRSPNSRASSRST